MVWPFGSSSSKSTSKRSSKGGRGGSKSKKAESAGFEMPEWVTPERILLGVKILALVLVLGLFGYGWFAGERALTDRLNTARATPLPAENIQLVNAPAWMPDAARDAVTSSILDHVDNRPIAPASLRAAADQLRQSPWVREVQQVRRSNDGSVAVEATYRTPVAVVESADGFHLVDDQAVRLPLTYQRRHVEALRLPILTHVDAPPPFIGQTWEGEDLVAGLLLLDQLAGQGWADRVTRIDVGKRDEVGRIRLVMQVDGIPVIWGLPPGDERAVEPDPPQKLRALAPVMAPGFELAPQYDAVSVSIGRLFGVALDDGRMALGW